MNERISGTGTVAQGGRHIAKVRYDLRHLGNQAGIEDVAGRVTAVNSEEIPLGAELTLTLQDGRVWHFLVSHNDGSNLYTVQNSDRRGIQPG
jgi:hypothetical protein